jgi:hypothetical protein
MRDPDLKSSFDIFLINESVPIAKPFDAVVEFISVQIIPIVKILKIDLMIKLILGIYKLVSKANLSKYSFSYSCICFDRIKDNLLISLINSNFVI